MNYCDTGCLLGRAPRTKETLPDCFENMNPDKWDTTVWYRVTRNPRVDGLSKRPRDWGRHRYRVNKYKDKDRRDLESTSKLRGVEVKIRPCIHEMDLTILYKL